MAKFFLSVLTLRWACLVLIGCNSISGLSAEPSSADLTQLSSGVFSQNSINESFIPVLDSGSDVVLGARFDTLTGKIIGSSSCIADFNQIDNGNTSWDMRLVEVNDSYSLMKTLNIDASVQGSLWGNSAGAKGSFVGEQTFNQQSQTYVLYSRADRVPTVIAPPSGLLFDLNETAAEASQAGYQQFRTLCGDAFISAIYKGIELYGTLKFNHVSQQDKKSISAEINGSYAGWSASASAKKAVEDASTKGQLELNIRLGGVCDAFNDIGSMENPQRWATVVSASGKLQKCAESGANMLSYKVVPYSETQISQWPFGDNNDPDLNRLLYYYSAYGAVLNSINQLIEAREEAFTLAVLNRGTNLTKLGILADEIREKRKGLMNLLNGCQKSSIPKERLGACKDENSLQQNLNGYVHPYVYRAQLPLFFSDSKPISAFLSNDQLAAELFQENVQSPRDVACSFADKSRALSFPACPGDFKAIEAQAKQNIAPTSAQYADGKYYIFQSQSTSKNLCMVAPVAKKNGKNATTSACNKSNPASARQRMIWRDTGQLYFSSYNKKERCVDGRDSAECDAVKTSQLWRFVPTVNNPEIGRLQNADGLCLGHSNQDINVTYKACSGKLEKEAFYLWHPKQVN